MGTWYIQELESRKEAVDNGEEQQQVSSTFLELGILSSVPRVLCGDVDNGRKHIVL